MEQARLRLSCDESSVGNFHRSFCIKGCGMGGEIPLRPWIPRFPRPRVPGSRFRRPKGRCAVVRKTPAHRGHDPEAYGAAEGDLRALKAEIYGCDTGSCGENTVDVGNVSHICTSDLMLCIRRSAKVYKTGNEYNRLNFTGHTRS